jgi:hypothetical protein
MASLTAADFSIGKGKSIDELLANYSKIYSDIGKNNRLSQAEQDKQEARGMLTGSPEDYTLANLSNIAAKDPELAKTLMAMRSADETANYYKRGGRSTQLTPAQKDKKDLAKIKVNKASELKAIGGAGMLEYMQGRFGHIMESTGFLGLGDDVSLLKGADLSTKAKVRKFMATNKKKLFPEGVPKTTALGKEIQAALDAYDASVEAGANAMLYQPEVAESSSSTSPSALRPESNSTESVFGVRALAPLGDQVTPAQEVATEDPIDNMAKVLRTLQAENANDPRALSEKEQAFYAQIKMNIDKKFGMDTPAAMEALQEVNALFSSMASNQTFR